MTLGALALALAGCGAPGPGMGDYGRHMRAEEDRRQAADAIAARPGAEALSRDEVLDMDTARATREAERAAFDARRAEFEPVAAAPLPTRPGDSANIVAYALRTTHRVGEARHRRSALTFQSHARNCAAFASADLAQEAFLSQGGPDRDPRNLDPDGDGFACTWSPEPFRAAARAN